MKSISLRTAIIATVLWSAPLGAQHVAHDPTASTPDRSRLGTISFPTSGPALAQADFVRGVLYMHSFEYQAAAKAFQAAQQKAPGFAMAYWGEAMTHTHAVWNQQDMAAARAVLARLGPTPAARAAKAGTDRERAWLGAVEILYGEGGKAQRDTLYAAAMADIAQRFPDDEADAFHSLAIMGLSQGERNVDAYMRAGAIALRLLQRNADHPGGAHYVIHAFDDPTHAPLGLDAAKAYSAIAPGAAHAQHMTTHIFLALGMWPEVISQNIAAAGPDTSRWQAGHYTYWLHYGYLQAGMFNEASQLLASLQAHAAGPAATAPRRSHLALARAQHVITSERWDDPSLRWELPLEDGLINARAADAFARGYAAIKRGDLTAAASISATMRSLPAGTGLASMPSLLHRQLEASMLRARGDKAGAERALREVAAEASALPVEFGPPDFVKPPFELLGEWMREDGRHADARTVFDVARASTPGRWLLQRR